MGFESSNELGEKIFIFIRILLLEFLYKNVLELVQILDWTDEMLINSFDIVSPVHDDECLFILLEDGIQNTFIRSSIDFAVDVGLASVHVLELGYSQCQHVLQYFFFHTVKMMLILELLDHFLK